MLSNKHIYCKFAPRAIRADDAKFAVSLIRLSRGRGCVIASLLERSRLHATRMQFLVITSSINLFSLA